MMSCVEKHGRLPVIFVAAIEGVGSGSEQPATIAPSNTERVEGPALGLSANDRALEERG